jgi:hypothetical protein
MPRLSAVLCLLAAAGLAGCATAGPDPLLRVAKADEGVVMDVRPIVRARPIVVEAPPESAAPATLAAAPPAERAGAVPGPAAAANRRGANGRPAAPAPGPLAAPTVTPGSSAALTIATVDQPVDVGVLAVGDPGQAGEAGLGLAYTVRRASDGVQIQVAQPPGPAFAPGARVRILYGPRIRLAPLG